MIVQFWHLVFITRICCLSRSHGQYHALFVVSDAGFQFVPANERAQLLDKTSVKLLRECAMACNNHVLCRVFDYGVAQPTECRLFEGDTITLGALAPSPSPQSHIGRVNITAHLFIDYNKPCSPNSNRNRYLTCGNLSRYECMPHTYWDSSVSMCVPQNPVLGSPCIQGMNMCREDLHFTCLQFFKCGPISYLSGHKLIDNTTLTSDTAVPAFSRSGYLTVINIDGVSTIFVADYALHHVIRFFDYGPTIDNITVVAKNWSGGNALSDPSNLCIDAENGYDMYVSDATDDIVVLFTQMQSTNPVPRIVGGTRRNRGSATYQLNMPTGVTVDSQGQVYIAEAGNHRITRWAPNATSGQLMVGTGSAGGSASQLNEPHALYLDRTNAWLYVADAGNHPVQRVALNGSFPAVGTTIAGLPNGMSGSDSTQLFFPTSVAVDDNETYLYVTDRGNGRLQRFSLL